VINTNLSIINFTTSDPDHPTIAKLDKTLRKPEQTTMGIIKIIQYTKTVFMPGMLSILEMNVLRISHLL
jgi:hypothetical protein